jgi:hypothetical protein
MTTTKRKPKSYKKVFPSNGPAGKKRSKPTSLKLAQPRHNRTMVNWLNIEDVSATPTQVWYDYEYQ